MRHHQSHSNRLIDHFTRRQMIGVVCVANAVAILYMMCMKRLIAHIAGDALTTVTTNTLTNIPSIIMHGFLTLTQKQIRMHTHFIGYTLVKF